MLRDRCKNSCYTGINNVRLHLRLERVEDVVNEEESSEIATNESGERGGGCNSLAISLPDSLFHCLEFGSNSSTELIGQFRVRVEVGGEEMREHADGSDLYVVEGER